ncbi:class I poly(R)-hydroxyalkanoic acid synthase [Pseudoalteromonas peptidolytica]|uniref:Polyhydroxyalkanoate synthase n=1 Tax=Pseudoalteromonas peptidolytica F12-50-A1 TaxID=1315280 RepID=A0A8I0MUX1_9GAMM|nr:class I poly(R)-hydroxyalkanoic acid synthase [Pseudoalteromonas peptidolytica]MBE0345629.1 polyhydroxyalkanoate synthase [Pseudoalteromonas peptidolytica F12-50-A1]NLR13563.1 class I poly(R)-hydroxyalkanoic acid synthase [Pseudoalteromonas peptidolytica]GEK11740.1 class I poly(R)-hydroxyalkanoic acid synthase [Pseudoalteromonas peptidolytica]
MGTQANIEQGLTAWWQYNQELWQLAATNLGKAHPLQQALNEQNQADFQSWLSAINQQPDSFLKQQSEWWQTQFAIFQNSFMPHTTGEKAQVVSPERGDKRFVDADWQENPWFNYLKQSYLWFGQSLQNTIENTPGLDPKLKERLAFFARQSVNSMSPSNFVSTNPELLRLTLESNGQNLFDGLALLKKDLAKSSEMLRISMTNENAYTLGEDLACTPGRVVFQNHLFELIQYHPCTEEVHKTPLLIVPPFVNKYYILDLRTDNSLVKWALEQGYSVLMISWKNPDPSMANIAFDDYVVDGVLCALEQTEKQTGETQVHAMGYCIGGTLLTTCMAYIAAKRMKQRVKSATLLTTILDFSQPGEIGAFINEPTISALEQYNNQHGVMSGHLLGTSFSMLRENSLYWNYFVNNYLKGKTPADLDLLYWNSDSTNLTAACHNFILRELYLNNGLIEDKAVSIRGTKIDLGKVKQPVYFLSTRDDHIALWQGTYEGAKRLSSSVTFVLGESGHIAGVINPPAANKYGFWFDGQDNDDPTQWFESAQHQSGSWWPHWAQWLHQLAPELVPARAAQSDEQPGIYDAPGEYVKRVI